MDYIGFLVNRSRSCKYSTTTNYLSAMISLHRYYGHLAEFRESYSVQLKLEGLMHKVGTATLSRSPLDLSQLLCMSKLVSLQDVKTKAMWSAILFCFRTLLRKSNVLPDTSSLSNHIILQKHIEFNTHGMIVHVHSSKTLKHKNRVFLYSGQRALHCVQYHSCVYTGLIAQVRRRIHFSWLDVFHCFTEKSYLF